MNFKKDEKVKAFVKLGLNTEPKWQTVKYVEPTPHTDGGHWCKHGISTFVVADADILRFTEIDQAKVEEFGRTHAQDLLLTLKEAMSHFQLSHLCNDHITLQEDDSIINIGEDFVTIEPGITERRTIGGFVEHACWTVSVWRHIPQTRDEPEGVDQADAGSAMNVCAAAQLAIEVVLKERLKDYFDNVGEAKAYAEIGSDEI